MRLNDNNELLQIFFNNCTVFVEKFFIFRKLRLLRRQELGEGKELRPYPGGRSYREVRS